MSGGPPRWSPTCSRSRTLVRSSPSGTTAPTRHYIQNTVRGKWAVRRTESERQERARDRDSHPVLESGEEGVSLEVGVRLVELDSVVKQLHPTERGQVVVPRDGRPACERTRSAKAESVFAC